MKSNTTYFRICQFFFVFACCFGSNFALSYLQFVHGSSWAAWRPGIGIALLFTSMVLSFVGYARLAQRASSHPAPNA